MADQFIFKGNPIGFLQIKFDYEQLFFFQILETDVFTPLVFYKLETILIISKSHLPDSNIFHLQIR